MNVDWILFNQSTFFYKFYSIHQKNMASHRIPIEGEDVMNNKEKVYIFNRVSPHGNETLLHYQENILIDYALDQEMEIAYVASTISYSLFESGQLYKELLSLIEREIIDVLLIWSPLRITTITDCYEEFEMYCNMHDVKIVNYHTPS